MARLASSWPVILVALATSSALAQGEAHVIEKLEGYETISPAEFRRLPAGTPDGKKYTFHYVKFNKLFGEDLKLFGGFHNGRPIRSHLHGLLKVEGKRLRAGLAAGLKANKDSDGENLVPKKSNIQVLGVFKKAAKGHVLLVTRVHLLDSFEAHFTRLSAELPQGDAQARLDLARSIKRAVRFYPKDQTVVVELIAALKTEARAIEYESLATLPDGLGDHIKLAKRHDDIELLARAWNSETLSEDDKGRVAKVLRKDLGARQLLGKWYGYEDYRGQLGFEKGESGTWVPREHHELMKAAAQEKKRRQNLMLEPRVSQKLLAAAAKEGDVVVGMPKNMVVRAKRGFPVRVTRVREAISRGTLLWAQWIMEDGSKVYFCNGFAFKKSPKKKRSEDE